MNILIYCDDPQMGGVGHHCIILMRAAAGEGRQVHYAQPEFSHPLLDRAVAEGVRLNWISYDTSREFVRTISDVAEAGRIFDQVQPDLVLFADCCHISNIAAKHIAISRGIPFIVICHSAASYHAQTFAPCLPVVRIQLSHASEVIAVSECTLQVTRQHYGLESRRGVVVHSGRPTQFFAPRSEANRTRIRQELGIGERAIICLTAARLCEDKGYMLQLLALAELQQEGRIGSLSFIWAGTGNLMPEIQRILKSKGLDKVVNCVGARNDIDALCDAADIFVLPTLHEAFGLSIAEAMGKRLAVIASRVGGVPEVLGDTGLYLSDPMSGPRAVVKELKEALLSLAGDRHRLAELGERAHVRSSRLFTESRMQGELSAIIATGLKRVVRSKGRTSPSTKNFSQEIARMFDRLKSGEPFSFSKYADGEWAVMRGATVSNGEFHYEQNDQNERYRQRLIESFQYRNPRYYVGVSCECCQGQAHQEMVDYSGQDEEHLTFANIFVNSNYAFYCQNFVPEYGRHAVRLVANRNAKVVNLPFPVEKFYPIGASAFIENYGLVEEIAGEGVRGRLFLFCAGPFGNILAHQLWAINPHNIYLDVGSTLNPWLQSEGFKRDYYVGGGFATKTCIWR